MPIVPLHTPSILDFKATLISNAGYSLVLTTVLLLSWFSGRRERALLTLGIAGVLGNLGFLINALPLGLSSWLQLQATNYLLLVFCPLALVCVRQLHGKPSRWQAVFAPWLLGVLAYAFWAGPDRFADRVLVVSLVSALYWGGTTLEFWRQRERYQGIGHWIAVLCAALQCLLSWLRLWHGWHVGGRYGPDGLMFNALASQGLFWLGYSFSLCVLMISYEQLLLQVREQAQQDGLTRLFNHRTFHEQAAGLFQRARERGEGLALLLIDLDHFKNINDRYGHQAGDEVLRQLADCLRAESRHGDLLGRHGGEEFVVMLPRTSRVEAYNAADRLRQAIAELHPRTGELRLAISASIGVACLREREHENLASLFLEADLLLYQAKRKGRNRVEIEREPEPALLA
ncbi:GGDEF domain-containing protein [Chromobacterium phragmitis]|uniref:diguanylate cyclase n=1 Tax=Chromobacterium phragmitis TaxID=2202141 RepID=A0ABV0ISY9_9NEIS